MNEKGNTFQNKNVSKGKIRNNLFQDKEEEEEYYLNKKYFLQKKREEKDIFEEEEEEEEESENEYEEEIYNSEEENNSEICEDDNEQFPYDFFEPYNIPKTNNEHKKNLEDLIKRSDIILEFIDIRNIKGTRCEKLENEIKKDKGLILVISKADIFSEEFINKKVNLLKKENNKVLIVSSYIREKINEIYENLKEIILEKRNNTKCINIGIIGYPNMGKNTFIKSMQLLNEANSLKKIIYFSDGNFGIDSLPGTIFEKDDNNTLFISKEYKDIYQIPEPQKLIEKFFDYVDKNKIMETYNFNNINNLNDLFKELSIKFQYDINDIKLMTIHLIRDIIEGKIHYEINE